MKRLLLFRHAKSDWKAKFESDRERPLSSRGIRAAETVGRFLAKTSWEPQLILSSPAVRARSTVELAQAAGDWKCPLKLCPELYESSSESVLNLAASQSSQIENLMLVGHNPTFEALASKLSGSGRIRMPTAAVASITFPWSSWAELSMDSGVLEWLIIPKLLKQTRNE